MFHVLLHSSTSQPLLHEETYKIIFFLSQGTPNYEEIYRPEKRRVYGGAQRLLQYCQLPD
jgi:hypothetical protein